MHITLIAVGTQGDVQPFVALGLGLRRAGHKVRIAAYEAFRPMIERHGLEWALIEGDPRHTMEQRSGQAWLESGSNPVAFLRTLRGVLSGEAVSRALPSYLPACNGTDAILYSYFGAAGYHVARKMAIPSIFALLQPYTRTRAFPSIAVPRLHLGQSANWWSHLAGEQFIWQAVRHPFNRWRVDSLGLPPIGFSGPMGEVYARHEPFLYGFSQHVVPRPTDWPAWHFVTGYWMLEADPAWTAPDGLEEFLGAGPAPIAVGFGSMVGKIAERLLDVALEAIAQLRLRAVILGGWAGSLPAALPDSVYPLRFAPHAWLFPKVSVVVHHGGAGTTAAGLRAGIPNVVAPFFADQPFWADRVHHLGAGPRPLDPKNLTPGQLVGALEEAISDASMRECASALGERLRAEDGVARAVEVLQGILADPPA